MDKKKPKAFWVTPHLRGRGVTVVVEEATHAVSKIANAEIGIVCLHNLPECYFETATVSAICLNLPRDDRQAAIDGFRRWIDVARPDVLLMNDVAAIEAFWPYIPQHIRTIVVLHDHAYGWIKGAIEHSESIDAIVTVSEFVERSVAGKFNHYQGIFRTVENGTSYPSAPSRKLHRGPLKLVFLGAIDRQKGAFDLPRILKECKNRKIDCSLTIIGGTSDALDAEFAKAGVGENVIWAGRLSREQCFDALGKGDVLLMLSRGESFGLVTIEAMSMGCVPIGYEVGGTADIIVHGESGYLVPLCSYKHVVRSIETVDKDRDLLLHMSEKCIKRSRERYSSESMAERYWKLIQDVLNSNRRCGRLNPKSFQLPNLTSRRYVKFLPAPVRTRIGQFLSLFPVLENYLRKFKGI